jgi:AraC-like DNA-binding protein
MAAIAELPAPAAPVSFDPNRPDFSPYGLSCVWWKPSPMRRPDHHNEIELNLIVSGSVTYLIAGRKVRIEAGRLSSFWAAIPHQIIEFGSNTEYLVATIPFPWFLQYDLPEAFVRPLLTGAVHMEPERDHGRHDRDLFAQWANDLRNPNERMRDIVMLEMEARLRRMAAAFPERESGARTRHPEFIDGRLNKVEQMAWLVARRYTEQLNVTDIAKAVGLHPNYAMSLFKKAFGSTLIDYLTHHRVSHAQRLLATTDEKIVEVAFSSGFNSISRFNQAFRRACGCSPREYRVHHDVLEARPARGDRSKHWG